MAKIPSRKFSAVNKKIPSRPFSKSKVKILSKPFSKGTAKMASRKLSKATEEVDKKPDTPKPIDRPAHKANRQKRLAEVKRKVTPASNLESTQTNSKPMAMQTEDVTSSCPNFFADIPQHLPKELIQTLIQAADVRIERIISHGHASAADFRYDQPQHEWVIVLKGAARLQFEDGMVEMKVGDFVNIPAFKKHRVDWTTPDEPTVWLGVRYGD